MQTDALSSCAARLAPLILLVYMIFICVELAIDHCKKRNLYTVDDTLQNFAMFFVNRMTGGIAGAFMFSMLSVLEHFAPWHFAAWHFTPWPFAACCGPALWKGIITFILVDFLFYLQHRSFHSDTVLAAFHEVHHTSNKYNFTTTLRASVFLPWINPIFYMPAVLLGCDALTVMLCFSLIQVYQFFLHTELVPVLPGMEGILNTPSAHRVHHGDKPAQYESNLGGVFLIWDQLFKSYKQESGSLTYGIRGAAVENNFFIAQVKPFVAYAKRYLKRRAVD